MNHSDDRQDFELLALDTLPEGWIYKPLGELVDSARGISYGIVQPGSYIRNGTPIVRVNNLQSGRIVAEDILRISPTIEEKYKRTRLRGGEVLLSLVGSLGQTSVVSKELAGWNVARAIAVIPVLSEISAEWVNYALRSPQLQHYIQIWATTTVQATLNLGDVVRLPIPIPPENERQTFIEILGALDDKIELNRRMNRTLESMARAVFRKWFVDNKEVKSWKVRKLGDIADVNWGDTSTTKSSYVDKGYPAYSAKGQDGSLPYYDFDKTGVVVSAIGANSGATWLALGKWSCIKNTLRFWATSDEISTEYLFYATLGNEKWPLRGSAQPFIAQADAREMKIVLPPNGLAVKFAEIVRPMIAMQKHNKEESRTLANLRDTLLPKLMKGEVRVKDVEKEL